MLGVELPSHITEWLDELAGRPSVAAEVDVVGSL